MKESNGKVAATVLCRLGNIMFEVAAAATYAKRTNRKFIGLVDFKNEISELQGKNVLRKISIVPKELTKGYETHNFGEHLCNGFPEFKGPNVLLNDFFQDSRCVDRDIALELFNPTKEILSEIKALYGDLSDYVAIQVRRRDYLSNQSMGFRHYTKQEIDDITNKFFPNDKIIFVSDDIEWCKKNFIGKKYLFADKPCSDGTEVDLYIQTLCKSNVISCSTFGWWGAFLNKNAEKVVCPWPWFADGKINKMEHILPENWIKYEG